MSSNRKPMNSKGPRKGNVWNTQKKTAQPSGPSQKDIDLDRERFLTVLQDMTGQHVNVKLRDNTSFDAIFHTVSSVAAGTDFSYVFKASRASKVGESSAFSGYTTKIVPASEVAQIVVASIVLKESQPGAGGFRTDTDISSSASSHLVGRELQGLDGTWFEGEEVTLESTAKNDSGKPWDQFEANYQITGKMATFDENLYTTRLDHSKMDKSKLAAAEKMAAEIEGTVAEDGVAAMHQAEERGQKVDTKGLDEEDLYSGVLVTSGGADGKAGKVADRTNQPGSAPSTGSGASLVVPPGEPKKISSSLNPAAKEFKFNPGAKSFVPGGGFTPAPLAAPKQQQQQQPYSAGAGRGYPPQGGCGYDVNGCGGGGGAMYMMPTYAAGMGGAPYAAGGGMGRGAAGAMPAAYPAAGMMPAGGKGNGMGGGPYAMQPPYGNGAVAYQTMPGGAVPGGGCYGGATQYQQAYMHPYMGAGACAPSVGGGGGGGGGSGGGKGGKGAGRKGAGTQSGGRSSEDGSQQAPTPPTNSPGMEGGDFEGAGQGHETSE